MVNKIGLIAGSGQFPLLFSRIAHQKGWQIFAAGYHEETDPQLADCVDAFEWFYLGQLKKLIKFFHRHHISQAVMMGAITKTRIFTNVRPDIKAIKLMAGMRHTHDDALLRAFAGVLEEEGIQIRSSTFLIPELLAPAGIWTRRKPSRAEFEDIRVGWRAAKEIGRLDIGQCVVVGGGSILAVEAVEGTDTTIRRGGELGKGQAIVVKVCKPLQDTRFDVPAVGLNTVKTMHESNIKAIAVEAGKALVFDRDDMIRFADQHKIAIVATTDSEQLNKE